MLRSELKVMGVVIGTVTGCDENDSLLLSFYDFEPTIAGLVTAECINIDYEAGILETFSNEGEILNSINLLDVLKQL